MTYRRAKRGPQHLPDEAHPPRPGIFHIAKAQTEAVLEPHGVADDLRRGSVSVIRGRLAVQCPSLLVTAPI